MSRRRTRCFYLGHYPKIPASGFWFCTLSALLSFLVASPARARTFDLTWQANNETNIAGYRVHYGTASGNYPQHIDVAKNTTSAEVGNLSDDGTYFFAVTAYNNFGLESRASQEIFFPSPDQLRNVSCRGPLQLDGVLISGFIVGGHGQKRLVIRALGPSLPTSQFLSDPLIELHDRSGRTIAVNGDWRSGNAAAILASGLAPTNDKEAAIIVTVNPGAYTAIARGEDGATGIGLIEVYDLDESRNTLRLLNSSARGSILTGDNILIEGVIVEASDLRTRVLVRGMGPSLTALNVPYALSDPTLQLYNGNGTVVAANSDWKDTHRDEITAMGVAPSDDRESVIIAPILPGNYTAILSGKNGGMGVGVIEAYSLY